MGNKIYKEMRKGSQQVKGDITWLDLDYLKEVFRKALELNIALKSFNSTHAQNETQRNMCQSSILNSKQALEKLDRVENAESFNSLIWNIGMKEWQLFTQILGIISGSLNDEHFYQFDKEITKQNKEKRK